MIAERDAARALLRWYADMGVDEAVGAEPADWSRPAPATPTDAPAAVPAAAKDGRNLLRPAPKAATSADEAAAEAARIAAACDTIDALDAAVRAFEGCALKPGATSTVFIDGARDADLLVVGEGPGRVEDEEGRPFVGRAGRLLDAMLAAIGRSRSENALITNCVYWRPPGNRTPTPEELAICRPFAVRLVELLRPKAIALMGAVPAKSLSGLESGILKSRGTWRTVATAIGETPALPMLHPAFLLRQPAKKRIAWRDLMALESKLTGR